MRRALEKSIAVVGAAALLAACTDSGRSPSSSGPSSPPSSTIAAAAIQATPILASVVAAPVPVLTTDGKRHLAYELQLTNALDGDATLVSLSVASSGRELLTLAGDQLASATRALGAMQAPIGVLGPGRTGLVWLDVALDASAPVPAELSHTIVVDLEKPTPPLFPARVTEGDVAPVTVSTHQSVAISAPLAGPRWLDGNSCCAMTAHRMAMNPINGSIWAAERFAVDYVQLSADGTMLTGDRTKLESYPYFGADVHAVADGPVVGVLDGLPEQVPGRSPTGLPLEQYGGNHVVQDIGNGNYAFYAHLKTDSVKVRRGDQLHTGQVVANLGNTGNSDAPHLHFHVMSTPDPLHSDGLPFVFNEFSLTGRLASMDVLDPLLSGRPATLAPWPLARDERNVGPLVLDVMSYADR